MKYQIREGSRFLLGATAFEEGVNFCLYSRFARRVELLLFEDHLVREPFLQLKLDPERHRSFCFWSVFIEGLRPGVAYAWRLDGPQQEGLVFDPRLELLDPWAKIVSHALWDREKARRDPCAPRPRAIVAEEAPFNWEGDQPLSLPPEEAVIYELHVGGFTKHPSAGVKHPGTFFGLKEKIPHLKELGITHVELLPIMAFDEQDVPLTVRQRGLKNFWGYSPHSFFALHPAYLVEPYHPACRHEFKELVKALHQAGIGVILDVVFNHTAEGGLDGPIINFKGIGNRTFYFLDPQDPRRYLDFTGCGNTIKCNHPLVAHFLLSCLEYWVEEYHVDGFRFDLASVLARGEDARPLRNAPIVWSFELSQRLERTSLIAEAWDAAGLYQVGTFPGYRWQEWNGRYRDAVRAFIRGDRGLAGEIATRIAGSSDLYGSSDRRPFNSINFVTCHDGFTLRDLVSYEEKHNQANGEENRDGTNHNLSANYGFEGETSDPTIRALRLKQAKNFLTLLFISQGVPMVLAGDELWNTQWGNNNAWCQDNEIGWVLWDQGPEKEEMKNFLRGLLAFRKRHPNLRRKHFLKGQPEGKSPLPDILWHGAKLYQPPWHDPTASFLAFTLAGQQSTEEHLHVLLNLDPEHPIRFELPKLPLPGKWHLALDTSLPAPKEILSPKKQRPFSEETYLATSRSVVIFEWR